jgi:hypothetical protein
LLGLACLPLVLGVAAILRHEWWRDEAYTWLVVRASSSLADLVARLGFNGHPRAYYLLAYALYHLSPSPLVLSLSNLLFAVLAIALFVRSAPFPPLHRALFSIGFFPLYQYGVIARSYSLFLFLLFLYVHLKVRRPAQTALRLSCLALLAQIHLMSLAAAGVLLFLELVEQRRHRARWSAAAWISAVVAALSLMGAVYQILPRGTGSAAHHTRYEWFVEGLAKGYFPDFDRLRGDPQHFLGLALFGLSWLALSDDRGALLRCALLTAPLLGMTALLYPGHRWHHGFYFVYVLVALWLGGRPPPRLAVRLAGAVFLLHAAIGAYALGEDLRRPYSNGREVARALSAPDLQRLPLVGVRVLREGSGQPRYAFTIDEIQPVLVELPTGRAYDPRAGTYEPYWRHYAEPDYFAWMGPDELVSQLRDIAARLRSPLAVVVATDLESAAPAPPPLRLLAAFPPPLDYGERLGLYLFPGE